MLRSATPSLIGRQEHIGVPRVVILLKKNQIMTTHLQIIRGISILIALSLLSISQADSAPQKVESHITKQPNGIERQPHCMPSPHVAIISANLCGEQQSIDGHVSFCSCF